MSQIPNDVLSMFAASSSAMANAEANTGEGAQGTWPSEGDHICIVKSFTAKKSTLKVKGDKDSKSHPKEYPCIECYFTYQHVESADPSAVVDKGLVFNGEVFRLVPDYDAVVSEQNLKTVCRIAWDRFKGHTAVLLGEPGKPAEFSGNLQADIVNLTKTLSGEAAVLATVRVRYRVVEASPPRKPVTYKTDFLQNRVS